MQDDRKPGTLLYAMNCIAGREGLRVRRGAEQHAVLADRVTAIMYHTSNVIFATDDTGALYDITSPASPTVTPPASILGVNGDWHGIEFATSAGGFLIATTDEGDVVWIYDGTRWQPLSATAPSYIPHAGLGGISGFPGSWGPGQTITGGTSGASATLVGVAALGIWVENVSGGPFAAGGETLTTAAAGTITSTGSEVAGPGAWTLTGPAYNQLTRPWVHGERLWYVEPGSQAAWYLTAGAFAGAATRFSLAGVFKKGGTLLAGGAVSSDSGSGMQSRCVFISTRGEIAIYEGLDPTTWSLVGLYTVGVPFGERAIIPVGGDLTIITEDGMTSVLTAIFAPRGTDKATEIMEPVRGFWRWMVEAYGGQNWTATWWPAQGYFILSPNPDSGYNTDSMVVTDEGKWSLFTGWPITASLVYLYGMLFGTHDGKIAHAEISGKDFGSEYRSWCASMIPGPPATKMQMRRGRCVTLALKDPNTYVWAMEGADLEYTPGGGVAAAGGGAGGAGWGSAVWGTATWGVSGGPNWSTYYDWQGLTARGHECIIGASILTNSEGPPKAIMQRLDWIAELGSEPW